MISTKVSSSSGDKKGMEKGFGAILIKLNCLLEKKDFQPFTLETTVCYSTHATEYDMTCLTYAFYIE